MAPGLRLRRGHGATGPYDECPEHAGPTAPRYHCEGIMDARAAYYEEPNT